MTKNKLVAVRLGDEHAATLRKLTDKTKDPLAPSVTRVIEHGIDLVAKEKDRKAGRKAKK